MCRFQQVWPIKARCEKKKRKRKEKERKKERKRKKVRFLDVAWGKSRKFGLVEPTKQDAIRLQLNGIIR